MSPSLKFEGELSMSNQQSAQKRWPLPNSRWFCRAVIYFTFVIGMAVSAAELPDGMGWHEIPDTQLRSICAGENGFPEVLGATGCPAITEAWSGGVFDTKRNRMVLFGGGHNDYYGNELYAFDLDTLAISRVTDPGLPTASSCVEGIVGGTQPNSRHTYDGIEYVEKYDRMFVFGGSLACGAGSFGDDTWTFDFQTGEWHRMQPAGGSPIGDAGMLTAYDPVSGLVYLHDRQHLYSYDVATDTYTRVSGDPRALGYHMAATIDVLARKFVIVGFDSVSGRGRVYTYGIDAAVSTIETVPTTDGNAIVGASYPGLAYDPISHQIFAWSEQAGSDVYSLELASGQWTQISASNGPRPVGNGNHGRWRYSPDSGVFVSVNSVDDNIFIFRSSDSTVSRPNPPTSVTVQQSN